MDWKSFFANVIGSLAWPAAALVIVLIFHNQIKFLLSQIKKIGAGGVNFEIAERVEAVRDQAEQVEVEQSATVPVPTPDAMTLDPATLQLAQSYPEAAVLQVFKELEGILLQIRAKLPDDKLHRNLNEVVKYLAEQNYISASVVSLFQRLREARNTVAHASADKVTTGEALELVRQTKLLMDLLMRANDQLPKLNRRI
jgi:hypothetical protein